MAISPRNQLFGDDSVPCKVRSTCWSKYFFFIPRSHEYRRLFSQDLLIASSGEIRGWGMGKTHAFFPFVHRPKTRFGFVPSGDDGFFFSLFASSVQQHFPISHTSISLKMSEFRSISKDKNWQLLLGC